jgi:GABA permease
VRILTFYVFSILLIVCVVPWDQIRVGDSPFTLALTTMNFSWASSAMSVIILTAVLSCLNSAFYVCSRVLFLLAEHGDAPQWLVQLNVRRVPTRSVLIGSVAGVVGVLAATLAQQTVFAFLVNASGALMVFVYTMVAVAQIRLRRERERAGVPAPALTMWLFPWGSYAAIGGMVAILIAMAITPSQAKDLYFSLVTLVFACLAYLVVRSWRTRRSSAAAAAS